MRLQQEDATSVKTPVGFDVFDVQITPVAVVSTAIDQLRQRCPYFLQIAACDQVIPSRTGVRVEFHGTNHISRYVKAIVFMGFFVKDYHD